MPRYAAFLRGINLGPRRKVSSSDLRALFEGIGARDVATFRTSGNVVFTADRATPSKLTVRIEEQLAESLGFEVLTFVRSAGELRAMAGDQPFDRRLVATSGGKLQVILLPRKPAAGARSDVLGLATDEDRLVFGERELYWLPSGGTRNAALNLKAVEKALGPTTMRTKGTIEELAAKHFSG